jgi:hypothetical protein
MTALLAIAFTGCAHTPKVVSSAEPIVWEKNSARRWIPSDSQKMHAEELARSYALKKLKISPEVLPTMKTDFLATTSDGEPVLVVAFFDPRCHQPNSHGYYDWMFGGFPSFFTIYVDPVRWSVVDHYAEKE